MRETYVNATENYQFGETEWYEPFTDDRGKLFRSLQKEYGAGRKMFVDRPLPDAAHSPAPAVPISERRRASEEQCGWIFSHQDKYEDTGAYYTREVWVELREVPDED
jgi:hypothetical protein